MNQIEQNNEHLILKKRLQTCRTQKGSLVKVPSELIIDIMRAWERWTGTAKSFYNSIGIKKEQLASIIKKGKRILKENADSLGPFTPIEVKSPPCNDKTPIVLRIDRKKSIRFYQLEQLIEFLKIAA